MATNIGTGPQDIPLNQFLGEMAFMDRPPTHPYLEVRLSSSLTTYDGRQLDNTEIPYNQVDIDTVGGYDPATGKYTIPERGIYLAVGSIQSSASNYTQVWWLVNGTRANASDWVRVGSDDFAQGMSIFYLNPGNTLGFKAYNNTANQTITSSGNHSYMKITKIS
jgi:hypothetical protein